MIEADTAFRQSQTLCASARESDHFTEETGQFLVMEYIADADLAEMTERNGEAFSLEDV